MADSSIKDVLALAEAITSKRENDREFQDVLNEMSATLAELREWLEKQSDGKDGEKGDEQSEAQAIGDAIAAALSTMPTPTVNVPAPVVNAASWKELDVKFETAPNGAILGARIKRLS